MSRIRITNDGECVIVRQGHTVIVIDAKQAESVAATIQLEYERLANQQNKQDQRRMQEFDTEVRSFHAVYVPPAEQFTDQDREMLRKVYERRRREMRLDGVDAG